MTDEQRSGADRAPLPESGHEPGADEPREIDLGKRSFADTNVAEDQRRQAKDRGAGLGAGGSDNRAARYPASDREQPEDDLD